MLPEVEVMLDPTIYQSKPVTQGLNENLQLVHCHCQSLSSSLLGSSCAGQHCHCHTMNSFIEVTNTSQCKKNYAEFVGGDTEIFKIDEKNLCGGNSKADTCQGETGLTSNVFI